MPNKLTAFSYSRLNAYETCPKKFYATSVAKTHKEAETEHTSYGTEVHLAFANYFKTGKKLPLHLTQYTKYLDAIKKLPGEFIVEQKLALNSDYEATGWFSDDVFVRIISDLTILNGATGVCVDHKTGKPSDSFEQLELVGACMFLLVPELEKIVLMYLWTKTKSMTKRVMVRDQMPEVWAKLLPRVQRYHEAHVNKDFPPRPSYLCRYCPVTSCPNWTPRR